MIYILSLGSRNNFALIIFMLFSDLIFGNILRVVDPDILALSLLGKYHLSLLGRLG